MLIQYANSTAYLLEEIKSTLGDAFDVIGSILKPISRYTHRVENQLDMADELTKTQIKDPDLNRSGTVLTAIPDLDVEGSFIQYSGTNAYPAVNIEETKEQSNFLGDTRNKITYMGSNCDEKFFSMVDVSSFTKKVDEPQKGREEHRTCLPATKDPDVKFGIWDVIKDSIGQDISKITVPVFFNEPLSVLQKQAQTMEYSDLLLKASTAEDERMRITYLGAYVMTQLTSVAEGFNKPFNPLLGETYELITEQFKFIAE